MNLLAHILNRAVFVTAESSPDGTCRTEAWLWHAGRLTATELPAARRHLAALVVCGHGVVTKPDASGIAARVRDDGDTFLWSAANGQTSFVRRERLAELLDPLTAEGIVPVRTFCTATAAEFPLLADTFAAEIAAGLRVRWLLRPTAESSVAAQVLVRRTAPFVLGAFLLLLAANAALAPQLQTRRQVLRTQLADRERLLSGDASADARRRELLAAFGPPVPSRAVLCDRIAGAVPERVVLTSLEIEPLTGRFRAGEPLPRRAGTVRIGGSAPSSAEISRFAEQLSHLTVCREVRLAQVEKERDGDRLTFRIEAAL